MNNKETEKYYSNTQNLLPSKNVQFLLKQINHVGTALELGCGAGRDTVFLIRNGWRVFANDINDTSERIKENLNEEEILRFTFLKGNFNELEFPNADLIVANNCLSFGTHESFKLLWKKICASLSSGGYFVGNFFGTKDEWNSDSNKKSDMIFFEVEEIKELFNGYEVLMLKEINRVGMTGLGYEKLWHVITVVAKKC